MQRDTLPRPQCSRSIRNVISTQKHSVKPMTSARASFSHTTAIAAGACARIDGGCMQSRPPVGVDAVPFGASLNRRGISR